MEIPDFQGLVWEVFGGFQDSTEVWDTSRGVQGGPGRPEKLRSEPLVSCSKLALEAPGASIQTLPGQSPSAAAQGESQGEDPGASRASFEIV